MFSIRVHGVFSLDFRACRFTKQPSLRSGICYLEPRLSAFPPLLLWKESGKGESLGSRL